jgi:glutathione peroxidase
MTLKQSILKFLYPLIRKLSARKNTGMVVNSHEVGPAIPFYSLHATLIGNKPFDFATLKGKKVLLVNLASNCGFTGQYDELETLSKMFESRMVILGFPSNDFKGQEPGSNEEIEQFCKINYGITFSLFTKAPVSGPDQQPVFEWLSTRQKNGWNDKPPSWNFCKYLVDEYGHLEGFFESHVSPLDIEILKMIKTPASLSAIQQNAVNEMMERPVVR